MAKKIEIKREIGEDTKITLTVKMFLWFLSGIIVVISTIWGWIYINIDSKVENVKNNITVQQKEHKEWLLEEFKPMKDDVIDMKGDIKVLIDRTNSRRNTNSSAILPPVTTARPPN